jgi:hypothetical protein
VLLCLSPSSSWSNYVSFSGWLISMSVVECGCVPFFADMLSIYSCILLFFCLKGKVCTLYPNIVLFLGFPWSLQRDVLVILINTQILPFDALENM